MSYFLPYILLSYPLYLDSSTIISQIFLFHRSTRRRKEMNYP
ncbi:hypothetical protein HMPREF3182_01185 [Megasphaera hutchinsoni]|uniref:Uncharacterized protein n=1 Tax=Megasphaera hutchinsoni TaxID=1588748 RepID=A0A134CEZ9_9FIRM|nr:hypothetical protein HMPREF3182_01185 [Megasphaera hutchinsoni]